MLFFFLRIRFLVTWGIAHMQLYSCAIVLDSNLDM